MHRYSTLLALSLAACSALSALGVSPITTRTLIEEMTDLSRLARWPEPAFRTIQFSSYDRRSVTSEAPGWFSNADGFGHEPIPGFLKVLREPRDDGPGSYLLAEVKGSGAIVRGWSAGMAGMLRVYLDPTDGSNGALIYEGPAYDFLARRSAYYLKNAGVDIDAKDALSQEDADYLPIPFAHGLRITWEGKLTDLHFYHVQVRIYSPGVSVRSFDPQNDLKEAAAELRQAMARLLNPEAPESGQVLKFEGEAAAGSAWTWSPESHGPQAVRELKLQLHTSSPDELETALRGCLLRIAFDGSQRPQVEAPVGDFFGSGPGINPFSSLPFTVADDGALTCRFVMPYEKSIRMEVVNYTGQTVFLEGSALLSNWDWDGRSLYFRAKWRVDHDLLAGAGALDLPFLLTTGKGRFVGCAVMVMNPSGVPTAGGNWWGEGDEKILVDGETRPSTFGTGSEDYFNYSWSRPGLFSHPFCGQALDSGPDTSGYISNHRFQITDSIPFEKSLVFLMELWAHNRTPGLSYARIVYHYARPGALDDHRALMPCDLRVAPLERRRPLALGGARGAEFFLPEQLHPEADSGEVKMAPFRLATQLQVLQWPANSGGCLKLALPIQKAGRATLHLVAVHRPEGPTMRLLLDGVPLALANGEERFSLETTSHPRVLNTDFKPVNLKAGPHTLAIECVKPGPLGLDYIWVRPE